MHTYININLMKVNITSSNNVAAQGALIAITVS